MRLKHALIALPLAAILLGATACSSTPADTPGATQGATPVEDSGPIESLTAAAIFDSVYGHFDPMRSSGQATADGTILTALYGQLLAMDSAGNVEPDIAESFTPNDDFSVWTLKLRADLEFSDGTPFDAEAVKWNFDRNSDPANGTYHALGMMGTTTELVDSVTIEVTPPEPNANYENLIASGIGMIVSPTAYEADPDGFGQKPVGAGPYVLKSWTKDVEVVLSANPDYWDAENTNLDEVVIKVIRDQSQMLNLLTAGEINIIDRPSPETEAQGVTQGYEVTEVILSGQSTGFIINLAQAPFDDIRARQAVAYAVDLDALTKVARGADAERALSYFSEDSPFFTGEMRPASNDPDKAQELLDELAADGKPLTFSIVGIDTGATVMLEGLQSQLLAYKNIDVSIDLQNVQTYAATLNQTHDFGLIGFGTAFVEPEPRYYDTFITDGNQNKMGFSNAKVDELLGKARLTDDIGERKAAYDEVQKIVADEFVTLKLSSPTQAALHDADLNLEMGSDGVLLYQKTTRG